MNTMKNFPPLTKLAHLLFSFLVFSLHLPSFSLASSSSLSRGSSLSVDNELDVLLSPDRSFSCGFYKVASDAYTFSIWFSNSAGRTPAWTANRDRPVYSRGSRVTMRKDGGLVLTDVDGTVVWGTNTSSSRANHVQLLNNGNLVVQDSRGNILWQSFDTPTDTLLPLQPFTQTTKLVSAAAKGVLTAGHYSLIFDNDNVLKLIYNGSDFSGIYWPNPYMAMWTYGRDSYNSSRFAVLDAEGDFKTSDNLTVTASDMDDNVLRRLTLDYDGNLRLYSLSELTGQWSVTWEALPRVCLVFGLCGRNGICSFTEQERICSCPPNHDLVDPSDWTKGCVPKYKVSCTQNPDELGFMELPQVDFWGFDRNHTLPMSFESCVQTCLKDCLCEGMVYRSGTGDCYTKDALRNGQSFPYTKGSAYIKVPKHLANSTINLSTSGHDAICNATNDREGLGITYSNHGGRKNWAIFYWFAGAIGLTEFLFVVTGWWFIFRKDQAPAASLEEGYKMISNQFRKFAYRELKKVTRNFSEELGRGGSGAVYKGVLDDKRVVAVKKLENMMQGEEEFQAELSLTGRIYHMNLVRMLGFCSEGSHRLLVSEYVENGALDKHLSAGTSSDTVLNWNNRFKIAVGVARGLAYLHHECLEWVIHCDIKPENILLDSDFEPKIADFGLVKLLSRGGVDSNVSRIRGTRGYMAPEWTTNIPITSKVDVYSYGVVLLELVSGTRVSNWRKDEEGNVDTKFMSVVRSLKAIFGAGNDAWIESFLDVRLNGEFNLKQAEAMVKICLSCLEVDTSERPSMDLVVQLLLSYENQLGL